MSNSTEIQVALDDTEGAIEEIPDHNEITRWVNFALREHDSQAQITIRFVDKSEGTLLNEKYRKKTGPTNVLSFSYLIPEPEKSHLIGDVVICLPVALEEAEKMKRENVFHLAHLVIHGVLHILGLEHESDPEAKIMEENETRLLQRLGFPAPYDPS